MIDRRSMLVGAAALAAMPASLHAALPVPAGNRLGFDIRRKGTSLGTHVLTFEPSGDGLTVNIAVQLVFKVLGVTLYRYRHRAVERWLGDRVVAFDSQTDDNGTAHEVSVRREGNALLVKGSKGMRFAAPADAMPATHWNRRELDGPWINAQDGSILRPRVAPQGMATIPTANGGSLQARHFALTGDVRLDMFYGDQLGWAGLSFEKGGSLIRYERQV
ncbi:MAG: hypothetical protein KGJ57_01790 [Sphingomonadales bacterium]|nr:hypothetical protein [Sphingomonadales bacterium]MDE2168141.1 hypothetical protein [Sphingomonadales bacterium]